MKKEKEGSRPFFRHKNFERNRREDEKEKNKGNLLKRNRTNLKLFSLFPKHLGVHC